MMRVKNEARWIERSVKSIAHVCESVLILDDHSSDNTADLATAVSPNVQVIDSPYAPNVIDEARDKDYLLSFGQKAGLLNIGDWVLMIDGDEELAPGDDQHFRKIGIKDVYRMQILYLWNDPHTVRMDGIYSRFWRPSLFRYTSHDMSFLRTGNGGNFHCSNVPADMLLRPSGMLEARLLHWGYFDEEIRARKFEFYNRIDPNNQSEDCYRHITQGDASGIPADQKLMHAGPLRLVRI